MTTLYIRDVPDEAAERLKARAAAEGLSLSAYVARELVKLAARPTNAELTERIMRRDRSGGPTTEEIVQAVRESRP